MRVFARAARDADVALVYYSGHAMQFGGSNYLMPVDAALHDEADLRRLTRVDEIVADLRQSKNLRILVLDAGRDNPLADELSRSMEARRGLTVDHARALLARGYDQSTPYNMRHANSDTLSFVITTIGHAAGLRVDDVRTQFRKFAPFEGVNRGADCGGRRMRLLYDPRTTLAAPSKIGKSSSVEALAEVWATRLRFRLLRRFQCRVIGEMNVALKINMQKVKLAASAKNL